MVAVRTPDGLVTDLERLAFSLESQDLNSGWIADSSTAETRDRLVRTIRSYLIPRLTDPDAPLCVVFAGPTGSGKSTLVNSISGLDVSATGPLRPTTKYPVVLTSTTARHRFEHIGGVDCEVVAGGAPILERVALVDTPDIDSTAIEHRLIAESLIDVADVVVMVTSALRYADLVPWEVLRRAMSRGVPIIFVLNRVTSASAGAIVDFKSMLTTAGVEGEVIRIPEHHIDVGTHSVPSLAVRELARQFVALAKDRDRYRKDVLNRVVNATTAQATDLVAQIEQDRESLAGVESDIRLLFADRAGALDLSGLARLFGITEAPHTGRLRAMRWRMANRPTEEDLLRAQETLRSHLVALVESDLRAILVEADDPGISRDSRTGSHAVIGTAVDGWLDAVHQSVLGLKPRDRSLGKVVLMLCSMDSSHRGKAEALFGDDCDHLLGDTIHQLRARLQVAYAQTGELLCESLQLTGSEPEVIELHDRITGVIVRAHFADA